MKIGWMVLEIFNVFRFFQMTYFSPEMEIKLCGIKIIRFPNMNIIITTNSIDNYTRYRIHFQFSTSSLEIVCNEFASRRRVADSLCRKKMIVRCYKNLELSRKRSHLLIRQQETDYQMSSRMERFVCGTIFYVSRKNELFLIFRFI